MLPGLGSDKERGTKKLSNNEYQLIPLVHEGKEDEQ